MNLVLSLLCLHPNTYDKFYRYVATEWGQDDPSEVPRAQNIRRQHPDNDHLLKFCVLYTSLT